VGQVLFRTLSSPQAMSTSHSLTAANLAASYARKSTPDDLGLQAQLKINRERARKDGFTIPDDPSFVFADDDTSGRRTSRSDLDRLVALVCSGNAPFTRVYIKDKTREGRFVDPRYSFFLQVLFEKYGVKICYSDRERQLDFSEGVSPEDLGNFLRDVIEGFTASDELARLTKRVYEGSRSWVMRGFYPGSQPPYGLERWYADERTGEFLKPVDENAVIRRKGCRFRLRFRRDRTIQAVIDAFNLVEAVSLSRAAAELNKRGYPAPGGGRWHAEAVRRIVSEPLYTGDLVWGRTRSSSTPVPVEEAEISGKEPILYRDFVEDPPVSREQFERVQTILRGNEQLYRARRRKAPQYLLAGMITCDVCGATFHGHTSTKLYKTRRRYYRHGQTPKSFNGSCVNKCYLRADELEAAVTSLVGKLLTNGRLVRATEEAIQKLIQDVKEERHVAAAEEAARELEQVRRRLERLVDDRAAAATEEERAACQARIDALNREAERLRKEMESHRQAAQRAERLREEARLVPDRADRLRRLYESATPSDKQRVCGELIPRIRACRNREIVIEVVPI